MIRSIALEVTQSPVSFTVSLTYLPGTYDLHNDRTHGEISGVITARDEAQALRLVRTDLIDIRDKMAALKEAFISRSRKMVAG